MHMCICAYFIMCIFAYVEMMQLVVKAFSSQFHKGFKYSDHVTIRSFSIIKGNQNSKSQIRQLK
jgi:phosphate starvation-inducible membrane PsiE